MSQSPMGWYEDDDSPGIARWWDGERWTEHTMVISADLAEEAEQAAPAPPAHLADEDDELRYFPVPAGDEPLPPRHGPTRFPRAEETSPRSRSASSGLDPTTVGSFDFSPIGELDDAGNPFFAPEPEVEPGVYRPDWLGVDTLSHHRSDSAFADRYRSWPGWVRLGLPVLALVLMVGLGIAAARTSSSGTPKNADTSDATYTPPPSSTTTAVTFLPLGPPSSIADTSTSAPTSTTVTTVRHTATTAAPATTAKPTTTTTAPATTTSSSTTTSTTSPATTTSATAP